MGGKPTKLSGRITKEYLERYPDLPSLTISKMMHKDHPAIFSSSEDARSKVRYYRGASGDRLRKSADDKYFRTISGIITEESLDESPYIVKDCRSVGVIGDLHIPNHRVKPIDIALNKFAERSIDTLILNGDVLDNTPYTKHDCAPPSHNDAIRWLEKTEYFLETLRGYFPYAEIIWTEGNHDHWYKKYLSRHAPMMYGDNYYQLEERLHLSSYKRKDRKTGKEVGNGIVFVPEHRYVMVGKLAGCHGHHLLKGLFSPVNAARGVYMRAKQSCFINHVHTTSEHTETDLHGNIVTCWSFACACELNPRYQPMGGKSNHGFGHVEVDKDGDFSVTNYRIHKGKLLNK